MEERMMSNSNPLNLSRRAVLIQGLAAAISGVCIGRWSLAAGSAGDTVAIENFAASGKSTGVVTLSKVIKSDAEWRSQLAPLAYTVTRREGTEYAGTGPYTYNHADGLYRCICCGTALYDSKTKYDSHTGWPSFWQPISTHNVFTKTDRTFGDVRDAIACRLCDAHLGHVFDDGPKPTGQRYCMNSVALNFVARA
jgi:peptide-methionine (R)-S-oxide reductase